MVAPLTLRYEARFFYNHENERGVDHIRARRWAHARSARYEGSAHVNLYLNATKEMSE